MGWLKNRSIKTAFTAYAVGGVAVAACLVLALSALFSYVLDRAFSDLAEVQGLYLYDEAQRALVTADEVTMADGSTLIVQTAGEPLPLDDARLDTATVQPFDVHDAADPTKSSLSTVLEAAEVPAWDAARKAESPVAEEAFDAAGIVSTHGYVVLAGAANDAWDMAAWTFVALSAAAFLTVMLCTARLFYRSHLRPSLVEMDRAAKRIAAGNLDFTIDEPSRNELGRVCGAFERMRTTLQDSNRELWRSIERQQRTRAALAHDLRTPLTVVKGQAETLEQFADRMDPGEVAAAARSVREQAERLERYAESLRDAARLDSSPVRRAPFAAERLRQRTKEAARAVGSERDVAVEVSFANMPDVLFGDEDAWARIAENLLENAARFAVDRVNVRCSARNGDLVLEVSDDGPGFSPQALAQGTDAFFKESARDDSVHCGLGLHVCRTLAEALGGSIVLANKTPHGAVVMVSAPLSADTPDADAVVPLP